MMCAVTSANRVREAKLFLASRIAEEAEREGVPLSEIERKVLYYSESGWTLPDMEEVSDAFRRGYDRRQFERRMARLIRRARTRVRGDGRREFELWNRSIRELQGRDDHYLFSLIAAAQPEGEIPRLIITALVVIGVMAIAIYLANRGY